MNASMNGYDTIVIGSGAGGLTTAICLAMNGQKVLVLERHYVPGGWCHSFQLNGQKFSPGVHYIGQLGPGGNTRLLFEDLEIAEELTFFQMKHHGYEHVLIGDYRFDYPDDREEFRIALCSAFPSEADGIVRYLKVMEKMQLFLDQLVTCETGMSKLKLFLKSPTVLRYAFLTLDKVISKFIKDPQLKAVLNVQWGNHGVLPAEASFLYHCGVVNHYANGGYYPLGGGGALVKAMTNKLKKYGGEIRVKAPVEEIIVQNHTAIGVRLEDGTELFARNIVSNADPHTTMNKFLSKEKISRRLAKKLSRTRYSYASVLLFLTLDIDPKKYGLDSGNYWVCENNDLTSLIQNTSLNALLEKSKFPMVFVSSSTLKDPSSYDGLHFNVEVVTFVEVGLFDEVERLPREEYLKIKQRLSDMFLANLELLVPDIRKHIVQMEIGTPRTNKLYINSTGGNAYGTHKTIDQLGPGAFKHKSEIKNLYLCGSSTFSHGIAGAMNSGVNTAKIMLNLNRAELFRNSNKQQLKVFSTELPEEFPEYIKSKMMVRKSRQKPIMTSEFLQHIDPNHVVKDVPACG